MATSHQITAQHIRLVAQRADCLFTETEVEGAIRAMARNISAALRDSEPLVMVIMNGGLVVAGKLLTQLDFPLQVDYLHATRYRDLLEGAQLQWQKRPQQELTGRSVLLIDDILDEGETLARVVDYCRQQGAGQVLTAVLIEKLHDHKLSPIKADFVGLRAEDRYLYGYGMDYKGFLRNAAGIYAVSEEDA